MSDSSTLPAVTSGVLEQALAEIVTAVHPLMAEAFYLAAVPYWYTPAGFAALRQRADQRNEGLIERLNQYSFVILVPGATELTYRVQNRERDWLQRDWIAKDPTAYRQAHQRTLTYLVANPDPDSVVQAQLQLYHQLFIDVERALSQLRQLCHTWASERRLAAIERLLNMSAEAQAYLQLLHDQQAPTLHQWLLYWRAYLAQLRGQWPESDALLRRLRYTADLPPALVPYVARARGLLLAHNNQYVEAAYEYNVAIAHFDQQIKAAKAGSTEQTARGHTLLHLGDAYVELALSARGYFARDTATPGRWWHIQNGFFFFASLPLVIYLTFTLGLRVWRRRFWPTLRNLDWVIARLFATGARQYSRADVILEAYGSAAEGVAADEKQAFLFLRLGDAAQAKKLFGALLTEAQAPLIEYRRAINQAGLGQALLWLGEYAAARTQLELALPTLQRYEDQAQVAATAVLLADTLVETGEIDQALTHYHNALRYYQEVGNRVRATELFEQLDRLQRRPRLTAEQRATVTQLISQMEERHYPVRYRSWITRFTQRAMLVLLALVIFWIPLSTIKVDTRSDVSINLSFQVAPLLKQDDAAFKPRIQPSMHALNVTQRAESVVYFRLGFSLFLAYLLLTTLFGLVAMRWASLQALQDKAQAQIIRVYRDHIQVGGEMTTRLLHWDEISDFTQADVRFWDYPMIDNTATALAAPNRPVVVHGATVWYQELRDWLAGQIPSSAHQRDVGYSWLRSIPGVFYLLTLTGFVVLAFVISLAPHWWQIDAPLTAYSLLDLYPYLFLGLFLPPVWWFVIQPMRIRRYLSPTTNTPWWMLICGLALFLFLWLTGFRPWLTVPDLYPALTVMVLVISAAWMISRVQQPGTASYLYSARVRTGVRVVALLLGVVMVAYLGREVRAYHQLVIGNNLRDQALRSQSVQLAAQPSLIEEESQNLLQQAVIHYERARAIAARPLLGRRSPTVLQHASRSWIQPNQTTWYSALNSRATSALDLGDYATAIQDYTTLLAYPVDQAHVYANRAIARQRQGTLPCDQPSPACVDEAEYTQAIKDFSMAIDRAGQQPEVARYRLWRGAAYDALSRAWIVNSLPNRAKAQDDYQAALQSAALKPAEQAQAWIGQGWIYYINDETERAGELFQQAIKDDPSASEAYLGLGYTDYTSRRYDDALKNWQQAATLAPDNPAIRISIGTFYWRLATLPPDNYFAPGRNRCNKNNYSEAERQVAGDLLTKSIENLQRSTTIVGQEKTDVAYTYRTMGYVYYLLRDCPAYDKNKAEASAKSLESFAKAADLDPTNAKYHEMRGRIAYTNWLDRGQRTEDLNILGQALPHLSRGFEGSPELPQALNILIATIRALIPQLSTSPESLSTIAEIQKALPIVLNQNPATGYNLLVQFKTAIDKLEQVEYGTASKEAIASAQQTFDDLKMRTPEGFFAQGLQKVGEGQSTEARLWVRQGITLAVTQGRIAPVATVLLDLLKTPTTVTAMLVTPLFQQALADLENAAQHSANSTEAAKLALLAVALEDWPRAGAWYNEAMRRLTTESGQFAKLEAMGTDLYTLWGVQPISAIELWQAVRTQSSVLRERYPDLTENGLFWRYQALFNYNMGMATFRRGEESLAHLLLATAIPEADRSVKLIGTPENSVVIDTYFREAGWGAYYVARAKDEEAANQIATAYADFVQATTLIRPDKNDTARGDLLSTTFKAGLLAVRLGDGAGAENHYAAGLALVEQYRDQIKVADALSTASKDLQEFSTTSDALSATIADILAQLQAK